MSHRGPRAVEIVLSDVERAELGRWAVDEARPRLAERARIIMACADGTSNAAVAAGLGLTTTTVGKWRSRFPAGRLAGLADQPRPGRVPLEKSSLHVKHVAVLVGGLVERAYGAVFVSGGALAIYNCHAMITTPSPEGSDQARRLSSGTGPASSLSLLRFHRGEAYWGL
jgi:hypothetical protein